MTEQMVGQMSFADLDLQCGRMFPEHSVQTREKTSEWYLKNSAESKSHQYLFLDLRTENGIMQEASSETDGALLGESLMLNTGEFPNEGKESFLSQILEVNAPKKYYLSKKSCEGIIRRANKRGKVLPELLQKALDYMIRKYTMQEETDTEISAQP